MSIDANEVEKVYVDCLVESATMLESLGVVAVEGVLHKHAFLREQLDGHRETIVGWLRQMPDEFHESRGSGWSFMNACNTKDGEQWTGLHQRMDQLFAMGQGLGVVKCAVPRKMWFVFPDSMPYYTVNVD